MSKKKIISKQKTIEEIRNAILNLKTPYDPKIIMREAEKVIDEDNENNFVSYTSPLFRAMTLCEFENAYLLANTVPEAYRTFGVNMFQELKKEYDCTTVSEQATAELATLSYVRMLAVQHKLDNYLGTGELRKLDVMFFSLLSKDLDRATRQYFTAIQMLRMLKHPLLMVNIKTNTAIVGQSQVIQENRYVNTPI